MENEIYEMKKQVGYNPLIIDGNPIDCYIPGTNAYRRRKLLHNTHRSVGP